MAASHFPSKGLDVKLLRVNINSSDFDPLPFFFLIINIFLFYSLSRSVTNRLRNTFSIKNPLIGNSVEGRIQWELESGKGTILQFQLTCIHLLVSQSTPPWLITYRVVHSASLHSVTLHSVLVQYAAGVTINCPSIMLMLPLSTDQQIEDSSASVTLAHHQKKPKQNGSRAD